MNCGPRMLPAVLVGVFAVSSHAVAGALTPGNVLVVENDELREYTPAGAFVQSFSIPYPGGRPPSEDARDAFVDTAGLVHVYNGTFDPYVSTLDPVTAGWTHNNFPDWDTSNNVSFGGITFFLGFVFVTDMGASSTQGIVRFDTSAGFAAERFAQSQDYIDLTIGLDSLLYALRQSERDVDVYDPWTKGLVRSISLPTAVRGCTVNFDGELFCASWDGSIYHFDPDGAMVNSLVTGVSSVFDIDITFAGELLVGSRIGEVFQTDESLATLTSITAGTGDLFVAYAESSIPPVRVPFFTVTSTDGENLLEWLNPVGGSYAETVIRYTAVSGTSSCVPPANPSDGLPLVAKAGILGTRDFHVHGGLPNDNTTYCYTAFVDGSGGGPFSGGREIRGRPFDSTAGPLKWVFATGAASMTPPSVGTGVYALSNDRAVYGVSRGPLGGSWLAGFTPVPLGEPAQNRAPAVPTSAVAGSDEVLFVGSQDGFVYAVDAKTGALLWKTRLGDMVQAAPAGMFTDFGGAFDYVLVGTRNVTSFDNFFYVLSADDGSVVGAPFDGAGRGGIGIISGGAAVRYGTNRVFFTSRYRAASGVNSVWALDLSGAGGSFAWARDLPQIEAAIAPCGNKLFAGTTAGEVYALATADGATLWSFPTFDGAVKAFVVPDCAGIDLYFSTTSTVWGIRYGAATPNWPEVTSIPSPSTPLLVPGTRFLLVGGGDGRLYQLDLSVADAVTPPDITSVVLGDGVAAVGSPSFDIANDIVYVGTDEGRFYSVQLPIP